MHNAINVKNEPETQVTQEAGISHVFKEQELSTIEHDKDRTETIPPTSRSPSEDPYQGPLWKKILAVIFKYFYYYVGFMLLFLHLPVFSKKRFSKVWIDRAWLLINTIAFIGCYTLPFAFVFVSFATLKDSYGIYVTVVLFIHVNLLVINKVIKERCLQLSPVFNFKDPQFPWFTWKHISIRSVKKKMEDTKTDQEVFAISYFALNQDTEALEVSIQNDAADKLSEVRSPKNPEAFIEESIKFRVEDAAVYKDVRSHFKRFSFVVLLLRLALMVDAMEVHYNGHTPYQLWLSVGVFGTVYLEFAFNRNLDMVCQIVTLKRLRSLTSLTRKKGKSNKMNMSCPISFMTWIKMVEAIQLTGLDFIRMEDVLIFLYIGWFLLIVVVVICEKIYRFDEIITSSDMIWVYSIDLLTLCYQIIVRLFYGEKVNEQLTKMQLQLVEITRFYKDLRGYLKPLLNCDLALIKFENHRHLRKCLDYSFREEKVGIEAYEDRVEVLGKTLDICLMRMNELINNGCYMFLGLVPCNKKFFYSVVLSLLTVAGSALFTQYWKHS